MDLMKWRPPYAHVPGINPRHAEELFDPLKFSVSEGMSYEELRGSAAWAQGLTFMREGYYWESHEVLEVIWFNCIQLANAGLKKKMQRENASTRLLKMADDLFEESLKRSSANGLAVGPRDFAELRKVVFQI